jgi:hypothetical protein
MATIGLDAARHIRRSLRIGWEVYVFIDCLRCLQYIVLRPGLQWRCLKQQGCACTDLQCHRLWACKRGSSKLINVRAACPKADRYPPPL